jgi:PhnB protein
VAIAIDPYLFFPGSTEEAITFYQSAFGGDVSITRRGDVDPSAPEDEKGQVLNASLTTGELTIRASDRPDTDLELQTRVELSIVGEDEDRLRKLFQDLSQGGTVRMALEKQFWGDTFGALTDKFGIGWQVNIGKG